MKFFTGKETIQKILVMLLIVVSLSFVFPQRSHAGFTNDLLKELVGLFASLGDVVMGVLNESMVGTDSIGSVMLEKDNPNLSKDSGSWLKEGADSNQNKVKIDLNKDLSDDEGDYDKDFEIPNMIYSPENIFANHIAALDVNFFADSTYTDVYGNSGEETSISYLKTSIATWYKSFRNISVVGLLSVLLYLGIRIMLSSTAPDKAKYKENLKDWLVAMCLVFIIHFIMAGILMMTEQVTSLLDPGEGGKMTVQLVNGKDKHNITFNTNLMGLTRFRAQSQEWKTATAYTIMYFALIIYTVMFTIIYFKRVLYMAFLTMIAPLVALTYPLDKAGDGKAQAFNMWFKEYLMNALIQPVHLVIYTALVSTAINLVEKNIIYALVAIGFIIPAEKLIKSMFNLNKADSVSGLGAFAGGALAMQGLNKLGSLGGKAKGLAKGGNGRNGNSEDSENNNQKIRTQDRETLGSFNEQNRNSEGGIPRDTNIDREQSEEEQQSKKEMDKLEEELGQYDNNDILMNDELRGKQERYEQLKHEQDQREQQRLQAQQAQNGIRKGYKGKLAKKAAIKGVKKLGKASKLTARAGLAAGGAMIGTAAGIATGDMSNVLKGAGIGMAAGNALGKSAGNLADRGADVVKGIPGSIRDKVDSARYEVDKEKYGEAYAMERLNASKNDRAKKQFMKNKDEEAKYADMASRIRANTGRDYTSKQLMDAAFDYKKSGLTDEKMIEKGLTLEAKHEGVGGANHDKMIDIMDMTQTYGKDYILDEKKRNQTETLVKSAIKGKENQDQAMELFAEAHGLKDFYRNQKKDKK